MAETFSKDLVERFRSETDRACVILGGALLDESLLQLIRANMVANTSKELLREGGPLGSFSMRIKAAYSLGLISTDEMRELDLVRRMRNSAAHNLDDVSFDKPPWLDQARSLKYPVILVEAEGLTDEDLSPTEKDSIRNSPRRRFEITVGILAQLLTWKLKYSVAPRSRIGFVGIASKVPHNKQMQPTAEGDG